LVATKVIPLVRVPKKSMFEEQVVKNFNQNESPIILEKYVLVQWGIQCDQMKFNGIS